MKKYLLIILLLSILTTGILLHDKVIVVQFVIPQELLPYYEWLITFPGLESILVPPAPESLPIFETKEL